MGDKRLTDVELGDAMQVAVASLRTAVNYSEAYGGPVVDGSMYSPSDRAVHRAEYVYQHGTDEQWEQFVWELEKAYDTLNIVWVDGMAWRADDLPEAES
jgi:hypothetical protein